MVHACVARQQLQDLRSRTQKALDALTASVSRLQLCSDPFPAICQNYKTAGTCADAGCNWNPAGNSCEWPGKLPDEVISYMTCNLLKIFQRNTGKCFSDALQRAFAVKDPVGPGSGDSQFRTLLSLPPATLATSSDVWSLQLTMPSHRQEMSRPFVLSGFHMKDTDGVRLQNIYVGVAGGAAAEAVLKVYAQVDFAVVLRTWDPVQTLTLRVQIPLETSGDQSRGPTDPLDSIPTEWPITSTGAPWERIPRPWKVDILSEYGLRFSAGPPQDPELLDANGNPFEPRPGMEDNLTVLVVHLMESLNHFDLLAASPTAKFLNETPVLELPGADDDDYATALPTLSKQCTDGCKDLHPGPPICNSCMPCAQVAEAFVNSLSKLKSEKTQIDTPTLFMTKPASFIETLFLDAKAHDPNCQHS